MDRAEAQKRILELSREIEFHNHLYYVGIAHRGQAVQAIPATEGLAIYTADHAWITTCPWPTAAKPDEPLGPT